MRLPLLVFVFLAAPISLSIGCDRKHDATPTPPASASTTDTSGATWIRDASAAANEFAELHAFEAMVDECNKKWRATHPGPPLKMGATLSVNQDGTVMHVRTVGFDAGAPTKLKDGGEVTNDPLQKCIEDSARAHGTWKGAVIVTDAKL